MTFHLKAHTLTFSYTPTKSLLMDVSLELNPGELILIIGQNGCGKTTLLKLLGGLLSPQSGSCLLNEKPIRNYPPFERAQRIGYTDADLQAIFKFSVRDIIQMGRFPHGNLDPDQKVQQALERFDLLSLENHPINTLSSGERQRTNLAKLWAQEVPIWLLDEPLEHVDATQRQQFLDLLKMHLENQGSAIITSHHWEEFTSLSTQTIHLES